MCAEEEKVNPALYIGTSNVVIPLRQKDFPPEHADKSRLGFYATLFNSLEVNSSFYKLPKPATVAKWAAEVPEDFRFTFKLPKTVSHCKLLDFNEDDLAPFFQAIKEVGEKKGCVLLQLPPSINIEYLDKLDNLLEAIQFHNTENWPIAVEFRNLSWYEAETEEVLKDRSAFIVYHDMLKSEHSLQTKKQEIVFLRFHGPEPRYRGSYENKILTDYAVKIQKLLKAGSTVYVYFNNTAYTGGAYENARMLQDLLVTTCCAGTAHPQNTAHL